MGFYGACYINANPKWFEKNFMLLLEVLCHFSLLPLQFYSRTAKFPNLNCCSWALMTFPTWIRVSYAAREIVWNSLKVEIWPYNSCAFRILNFLELFQICLIWRTKFVEYFWKWKLCAPSFFVWHIYSLVEFDGTKQNLVKVCKATLKSWDMKRTHFIWRNIEIPWRQTSMKREQNGKCQCANHKKCAQCLKTMAAIGDHEIVDGNICIRRRKKKKFYS